MYVSTILKNKGAGVVTALGDVKVSEIVQILRDKRIGAVVISDDGATVAGILSERDIVRALAEHGVKILDRRADALMTRDVVKCAPNRTIADVMSTMTKGRFRHLPIVDDGKLVGIVTIGDVVKLRLQEVEAESEAMRELITGG